jgi:fermentation-respiration switch protein FrsA (DUF1100 family)
MIWTLLSLILWFMAAGGLIYLVAVGLLFLFQSRLIYLPSRLLWRTPADAGLLYEDVRLTAADGVRLHAWYLPVPAARGTILFFHGNAGNISHRVETARMFHQWQLNTLLIDYRGYGQSQGRPSAPGIGRDADAAWRFLTEGKGKAPNSIILFGRSLGAAVTGDLAARVHPAGAILESGFTSLPDIGALIYPWWPIRWLVRDRYPTLHNITRLRCPVLIAHSREDELIPFSHGERLFQAAPEPKFFLEMTGSHRHGVTATGMTYTRAIQGFIEEALAISASRSPE